MRWNAAGAPETRPVGNCSHAGTHGYRRATTRAAAGPAEVIRICRGAGQPILAYRAEAELRRRGLADQHAASLERAIDEKLVCCWFVVRVHLRAVGCPYSSGRNKIFEGDRKPMEGPALRCGQGVEPFCSSACARLINCHE